MSGGINSVFTGEKQSLKTFCFWVIETGHNRLFPALLFNLVQHSYVYFRACSAPFFQPIYDWINFYISLAMLHLVRAFRLPSTCAIGWQAIFIDRKLN